MKSLLLKIHHRARNAEIQSPASHSLDFLAHAIIKAVGFGMDHLDE